MLQEDLNVIGSAEFTLVDANGEIEDYRLIDNLVVNGGLALIASLVTGTGTAPTHIALGTSATALSATQTGLINENGDAGTLRQPVTPTTIMTAVTGDTAQFTATFNANSPTEIIAIEEAGLFNANSGVTMISRLLTGTITKQITATLTIVWKLRIQ